MSRRRRSWIRDMGLTPEVYFLRCERCGLVKIGYTHQVHVRAGQVERAHGHGRLTLLGSADGGPVEEARMHAWFGAFAVGGEWFALPREALAEVAQLARYAEELRLARMIEVANRSNLSMGRSP